MTSTLLLRCVEQLDYERRQAVARWQREGHPVLLSQPSPQTRYLAFWAQGCHGLWQGMIGARDWLHAVAPQWSQWLLQESEGQEILELFSTVSRLVKRIGADQVEWLEGPHKPQRLTIEDLQAIKALYRQKLKDLRRAAA